jgi:sugar phosphate isomerase/epimerase
MRFGIMAMQMESLIPSATNAQDVMAQVMGFDHAGLIRKIRGDGFKLIELGGDMGMWFPTSYSPAAIDQLVQVKEELGLSYTVHLPLWSVEPSTPLAHVRKGSARALIDNILVTAALEPECYVLHATGALAAEFYQMRLPESGKQLILRQFQQNAMTSIQETLSATGLPSRKLAIETIEFPFELTLEMAEKLDTSICLDTGHVLVGFSGSVGVFEVLDACLPRLAEVHLHDGPWQGEEHKIGYGKDHQALGKGDLDVGKFLDRLNRARFEGPIIFELTVPEALASLETIRDLRLQFLY